MKTERERRLEEAVRKATMHLRNRAGNFSAMAAFPQVATHDQALYCKKMIDAAALLRECALELDRALAQTGDN